MLLQGLKIAVPKPKIKHKTSIIKIGKITKGTVFQDENGVFKISIATKTDEPNPDLLILEFTDKSYDLTGVKDVFLRKNTRIRIIRNEYDCKFFPGLAEQYVPFAPNWLVKGYIVRDNGKMKFDFEGLIGINGYDIFVNNLDNE